MKKLPEKIAGVPSLKHMVEKDAEIRKQSHELSYFFLKKTKFLVSQKKQLKKFKI